MERSAAAIVSVAFESAPVCLGRFDRMAALRAAALLQLSPLALLPHLFLKEMLPCALSEGLLKYHSPFFCSAGKRLAVLSSSKLFLGTVLPDCFSFSSNPCSFLNFFRIVFNSASLSFSGREARACRLSSVFTIFSSSNSALAMFFFLVISSGSFWLPMLMLS